jgi:3-deoxy-D-manno-octulosonic-acid transferase
MDKTYRIVTYLVAPFLPLWLWLRKMRGKEDAKRIRERYGLATKKRPKGSLIWLHAASIGEANSILLLIGKIQVRFPTLHLLLTTGTVTSARMLQKKLPEGVIHQYVPVDTPQATYRFIRYWRPAMAFFIESELWPNLIAETHQLQCFMGLINARMSGRSFNSWKKYPAMIEGMLKCFDIAFAQSEGDAKRLRDLGAKNVLYSGNLKYDAAQLACDENELLKLKNATTARPLWLAASTHPGEEKMIAEAHRILVAARPGILTVIVPRHPERGPEVAAALRKYGSVALRSKKETITATTSFYIADTIGELGLFYRLCEIAFMGGSLVSHGGQNPLEAIRLSSAVVTGPDTHNFSDIYDEMEKVGACKRVTSSAALAAQVEFLLHDSDALYAMTKTAKTWLNGKSGAAERIFGILEPVLQLTA